MLQRYQREHPELEQLILRPGTVLGAGVSNQITAIFERPFILGLRNVDSPFVFIWDEDVAAIIVEGVYGPQSGAYNLAGDGALTLQEVARRVGKPFVGVPVPVITGALSVLHRFKLSQYGPEQVCFLQYRPVLANDKLKRDFPGLPRKSSREVFELYLSTR